MGPMPGMANPTKCSGIWSNVAVYSAHVELYTVTVTSVA